MLWTCGVRVGAYSGIVCVYCTQRVSCSEAALCIGALLCVETQAIRARGHHASVKRVKHAMCKVCQGV